MSTCATCVYKNTCLIYKLARESQIQHMPPDKFGCLWHKTKEEYKAEEAQNKENE